MTLPTFTPRPPETATEPLVEVAKGGKVTSERTVTRVVRWLWPCSACGLSSVVDVEGRCRACWRLIVILPAVMAANHETTGGTP